MNCSWTSRSSPGKILRLHLEACTMPSYWSSKIKRVWTVLFQWSFSFPISRCAKNLPMVWRAEEAIRAAITSSSMIRMRTFSVKSLPCRVRRPKLCSQLPQTQSASTFSNLVMSSLLASPNPITSSTKWSVDHSARTTPRRSLRRTWPTKPTPLKLPSSFTSKKKPHEKSHYRKLNEVYKLSLK